MACFNMLPHRHFNLKQLRIYKPAPRSPGSFFGDNNNYIPCICTAFFICRSQETSSKQAAIITSHYYQQRKWGAGKVNIFFCPKVRVSWGGWQELGTPWDLIQRRSHSYLPTLLNGLAWGCPKPNAEETAGKFWVNYSCFISLFFVFFKKKHFMGTSFF